MVEVRGFCIDRYEVSTVDKTTGEPLSPFYPPHPRLMHDAFETWDLLRREIGPPTARRMPLPGVSEWQRTHRFQPKAVSLPGKVPQAYMSYHMAKAACENAGKRLCTQLEWDTACRGERYTTHPYGNEFRRGPCNIYRYFHPAYVLHGASYFGHLDPRLNLLMISGDEAVLRVTGASQGCASPWRGDAVFDMVGNLDEWIDDERGTFRGGFYARSTTKGCEASIASHGPTYYDYSTGARCCQSL